MNESAMPAKHGSSLQRGLSTTRRRASKTRSSREALIRRPPRWREIVAMRPPIHTHIYIYITCSIYVCICIYYIIYVRVYVACAVIIYIYVHVYVHDEHTCIVYILYVCICI